MDRNPEKRKIQDSESAESKKTRQDEAAILERFRANFDSYLNQDPDFKSDLLEVLKKKEQRDKGEVSVSEGGRLICAFQMLTEQLPRALSQWLLR